MGRIAAAVMDGLEGGAGRVGSGLLSGFDVRLRAWSIGLWLVALVMAGLATVGVAGGPEAVREGRETMRVLTESGRRAAVPVVDDAVDDTGRGRDHVALLLELPADAGGARVWMDADRVPGQQRVVVGDRVDVVYVPAGPERYVLPVREFDEQRPLRSAESGLRTAWWALGLAAVPALVAAVLWRRGRRR